MKRFLLLCLCCALSGCVNGYSKFYRSVPGATPEVVAATRAASPPPVPRLIETSGNPRDTIVSLARNGYAIIGYSSFSSGHNEPEHEALAQGTKVGADVVVIVAPQYQGSVTSSIPLTTPTTQTSYSTGNATAFGSGGVVNAYGSSTTTTYGSRTTYIPVTVNRYAYGAFYLVKRKYELGVNWRELTDSERQQLQTNKGLYVTMVVNGSPAFHSDVLPGDVILAINGNAVSSPQKASETLNKLRGKTIELTVARSGKWITKTVTLGN